jgi:hypothetical protein
VFGVIVLFLGVALAPSINAIQLDGIKNKINTYDNKDLRLKHPLLFSIVYGLYLFRVIRIIALYEFSTEPGEYFPEHKVIHPLVYIRFLILFLTTQLRGQLWFSFSEKFGWDWLVQPDN